MRQTIDLYIDHTNKEKTLHTGKESSGAHLESMLLQWMDELIEDGCDVTADCAM